MSTANIDRKVECSHHFDTQMQEHETCKQGLWLFMATEMMMFGALFVAYSLYRIKYPDVWAYGGELLDWKMGALNTLVLIGSSWSMALAVRDTQLGKNKRAFWMVAITIACALVFLVVKYFEYTHKIHAGLFPGLGLFTFEGAPEHIRLFLTIYFAMTGLHGIHILIGIGLMVWIMKRLKRDEFSPQYFIAVEGVGLYWHIVDIIWIFLFPLMYLM